MRLEAATPAAKPAAAPPPAVRPVAERGLLHGHAADFTCNRGERAAVLRSVTMRGREVALEHHFEPVVVLDHIARVFEPGVRATGLGWAIGVGRLGAILSPLTVGALVDGGWSPAARFLLSVAPAFALIGFG